MQPPDVTPLAAPSAILVRNFSKRYGTVAAVQGLDLDVPPGEILGLVGPNGAGKTTTLRALAGILRPTEGTLSIAGYDLAVDPVQAKRRLAFIPDEPHLFDYLTVEEHLRFTARLYGVPDAAARIPQLLAEMDLSEKRAVLPSELSRGMKQKLSVAAALLHDPAVLILDEPLTGLDPAGIRRMKDTIRRRAERGTAVILSSHLLNLVEELCTRVLLLRRGEVAALGTIAELRALRPEYAAASLEDLFIAITDDAPPAGHAA
ncbi:MAG TPA: ABC transporter ATP-binding protein [Gemmatimonadaceae bacterium]|nr:ABC transporter ATP-binding protein [Gemmatimonadaceae bacterium]